MQHTTVARRTTIEVQETRYVLELTGDELLQLVAAMLWTNPAEPNGETVADTLYCDLLGVVQEHGVNDAFDRDWSDLRTPACAARDNLRPQTLRSWATARGTLK